MDRMGGRGGGPKIVLTDPQYDYMEILCRE